MEQRATRAETLTQLGELSSAREALDGCETAPGTTTTLDALKDERRRPALPRAPLPRDVMDFEPDVPFQLDEKLFGKNLQSSKRGVAGGPSGMTSDHLRLICCVLCCVVMCCVLSVWRGCCFTVSEWGFMCVGFKVWFGPPFPWTALPPGPPSSLDRPPPWTALPLDRPKFRSFFFPLPPQIRSSGCCVKPRRPHQTGPPGLAHHSPRTPNVHI